MYSENELAKKVLDVCFKNPHNVWVRINWKRLRINICHEWNKNTVPYMRQRGIKVIHDGIDMGIGFIRDIIIDNKLILELKSVENLVEVHYKQLLTYLRLTKLKLGLLINFNVPLIKDGIHRIVNNP